MVTELKDVLKKVETLHEDEQKQIAHLLQQELLWDNTFKNTQTQLGLLADEALKEFRNGKTTQTDW